MADQDAPKSAYEIAMARLQKKDKEEGRRIAPSRKPSAPPSRTRRRSAKPASPSARSSHRSQRAKAADPETLEKIDLEYRRDRERITSERDHKIEEIRKGK